MNLADLKLTDLIILQASLEFLPPAEGPQRFRMKAYDGGLLRLPNLPYPAVVDLAGMRQAHQVKALMHHKADKPVGHMDRVAITTSIDTEGVFSVPKNAAEITAAQKDGFEWEASIGATVDPGAWNFVPKGQTARVNGRAFAGPVLVAASSLLKECSFTGVGAGDNTHALAASFAVPFSADQIMPPELKPEEKTPVTPPNPPVPDASVTEIKAMLGEFQTLSVSLKNQLDEQKRIAEQLKADQAKLHNDRNVQAVDRIAAQYGAANLEILASLRTQAGEGKITENEIELAIHRAAHGNRLQGISTIRGLKDGPAVPHVLECAYLRTHGWTEAELGKQFDEKTVDEAIAARYSGFGPKGLMVEFLQANGHHVMGGQLQDDDIQHAVVLCGQQNIRASGGFSTLSLPGILSNVARKEMLRGYDAIVQVILLIAKRATTTDYKPFYMYRLNTDGLLLRVGPDGEYKSMELKEDEFTTRVYPWGRKLAMTGVMFKNDDAGAFADLARLFGITSARTVEKEGFRVLLSDQSSFWTTGKGNRLASGAGSALSIDSLGDADELFTQMVDSTGEFIGMEGKYLLTAPRDKTLGKQLFTDTNIVVAGETDVVRTNSNPHRGNYQPLCSPYFKNGGVTNANGTQFLLTSDPSIAAPLVAAFLDGQTSPQIKNWNELPGRDGMQWDVRLAFGFSKHDDKGSVLSPGQ